MLVRPTQSVPADRPVGVSHPSTRDIPTDADRQASATARAHHHPVVLLVEDDLKFAELLVRVFERSGLETMHTSTGDQALGIIQSGVDVQAAVLDVMIPHPDGLEVCRHLRRCAPGVPVIAVSARTGAQHRARALAAGAEVFLEKPFALRDLVSITTSLITRSLPEPP